MNIQKSIKLLSQFLDTNDGKNFLTNKKNSQKFDKYLKKHYSQRKISSIYYYLSIASAKGFLERFKNTIFVTEKYSDYIIEMEKENKKFIQYLIGSLLTIIGGIIGSILTFLLHA